jgi:hypothetical protein
MNDLDGFTLISIGRPDAEPGNQADYRILNTNGFGDKFNMYAWSMTVFDNTLYLGTFNINGSQLWYSTDGETWEVLIPKGFGSKFEWGIRCMIVANERLFIGTAASIPATLFP